MSQLQVTGEAKIRDIQGPVVANSGVITALDGAASQYVRGDGTLADFPTSSGGGSSVSYYLNSSVSQGTIGGVAYRELSKDPIIGTGTDIAISSNGYVANYITDANDPDVVLVPGGNFNCEFYFSVNNNTGNPFTYAELYKYDGTTFTLLGSSVGVPEYINQGTIIAPYYFAIPVATATLALTDRLAIRIYVNVDGRTVTLHTENSHLCQVVTTLSKGMVSLNNLTDQSQYLTTGTSGTDFNIVSSGDTHTFNLPVASATNTGKLSSTDWSTFNGKVPYTGATASVDLGFFSLSGKTLTANGNAGSSGSLHLKQNDTINVAGINYGTIATNTLQQFVFYWEDASFAKRFNLDFSLLAPLGTAKTFTLPDLSGTLALLEGTQTFSGAKTFSSSPISDGGYSFKILASGTPFQNGYSVISSLAGNVSITQAISAGNLKSFTFDFSSWPTNTFYTYTLPASDGTIALTSDLGAYVTLGTYQTITANKSFSGWIKADNYLFLSNSVGVASSTGYGTITYNKSGTVSTLRITNENNATASLIFDNTANYGYTFQAVSGTIALTSDLSAYLPLAGGTLTGALSGTSATFSGALTVNGLINNTYSDNAFLGLLIRNTNTGNSALSGFSIQNSGGTTVGQVNYVSTVYANTTLRNTLLINTVFDNKLAFVTNSSGGATRADIYFSVNPAFALDATNPNQIHILGTSRNVAINYSGTDYGQKFQVNGSSYFGDAATFSSSVTAGGNITSGTGAFDTGGFFIPYSSASTSSRNWKITNDQVAFGDFSIKQSSTQTGLPDTYRLYISAAGNVGIGTSTFPTSTNRLLFLNAPSGSAAQFLLGEAGTSYAYLYGFGGDAGLFTSAAIPLNFGTNNTERMRITSGGNVLVGMPSLPTGVTASGGGTVLINNNLYIGNTSGTTGYNFRWDGYQDKMYGAWSDASGADNGGVYLSYGATSWTAYSDERLKNINTNIENAVSKLKTLRTVNYSWKSDESKKENLGLIAQDVEKVFPQVIDESRDGYLGVRYADLVPVLIAAIQEQQAQIEELKQLINK